MKIKRNIVNTFVNTFAPRFGYTVVGVGYRKRHYTMTYREALSWAACYKSGALIVHKGIIIAHRKAVV